MCQGQPVSRRKKNLLRIPAALLVKSASFPSDDVAVACVKLVPLNEIAVGQWLHLGICLEGDEVIWRQACLPPATQGRWSRTNIHGKTVVRRDLEKVEKSWDILVPNFGDWTKGSHYITVTRDVYPREYIEPREVQIFVERLSERDTGTQACFVFRVEEVLDRTCATFESDMLYLLNVLQENVYDVDVYPSDVTREQYLATTFVEWEFLPPGTRDEMYAAYVGGGAPPEHPTIVLERLDVLRERNPEIIVGRSGFRRYIAARHRDDLVVLENPEWGNALYIMDENWVELSQLSRIELMQRQDGFQRIVHRTGWQQRLRHILSARLD